MCEVNQYGFIRFGVGLVAQTECVREVLLGLVELLLLVVHDSDFIKHKRVGVGDLFGFRET